MLEKYLNNQNFSTEILREPGSTEAGEKIRDVLLNSPLNLSNESELLLMFAARAQLINEKIIGSDKDIILLDRFYDASIAYQGYGRGLSLNSIDSLIKFTQCPAPNITFLLDIDVKEGFKRKFNDKKDRIESAGNSFFEKVRSGYIEIAKNEPDRIKIIDASMNIDLIHIEIIKTLDDLL
jgi:dTMP kinase